MSIDDPAREQIYTSIKQDLFQFESYSKAIAEIEKLCDIPQGELKKLPGDMQELKREQKRISSQIIAESIILKDLINQEKKNERKIERTFKNITDLKAKLLDIDARLKKKDKTVESVKACDETGPEVKHALSSQYKLVLEKLTDARKRFPDIYSEVESDTGIHFFTPFA